MAEKTFDLQTSEQIVRKEAFVRCGSWSAFTGELVLANQALVYVNRGLFGNHEGYKRFELTEIAQAIFGEAQNGNDQLEVCYRGGVERLRLPVRREARAQSLEEGNRQADRELRRALRSSYKDRHGCSRTITIMTFMKHFAKMSTRQPKDTK